MDIFFAFVRGAVPFVDLPSIEETNMSESRSHSGKPKAISESKKHAQMNLSMLLVLSQIKLKLVINNGSDVIKLTLSSEQFRGKDGESGSTVEVKAPICNGDSNVDDQSVAHKDIHNGEERANERAVQEGGDSRPVKGEGPKAKAFHA